MAFDESAWPAIVAGDEAAFGGLVRAHHGELYRMLQGLLRDHDLADEAAQATWIKVWRARASFRGKAGLRTWIFRIGTRTAFDLLRQRKRRRRGEAEGDPTAALENAPGNEPDAARRAELSENLAELERAIAELSPKFRAVITLREIEGLSYEEIAQVLGCRVGTVMSRLHTARQTLRTRLRTNHE